MRQVAVRSQRAADPMLLPDTQVFEGSVRTGSLAERWPRGRGACPIGGRGDVSSPSPRQTTPTLPALFVQQTFAALWGWLWGRGNPAPKMASQLNNLAQWAGGERGIRTPFEILRAWQTTKPI